MGDRKTSNPKPIPASTASEVGAGAPEPAKCKAGRALHGLDLPLCFVKPTPNCKFGVQFARTYFCRHPQVERIIARTRAQRSGNAR
jgi:hypothetical protein